MNKSIALWLHRWHPPQNFVLDANSLSFFEDLPWLPVSLLYFSNVFLSFCTLSSFLCFNRFPARLSPLCFPQIQFWWGPWWTGWRMASNAMFVSPYSSTKKETPPKLLGLWFLRQNTVHVALYSVTDTCSPLVTMTSITSVPSLH